MKQRICIITVILLSVLILTTAVSGCKKKEQDPPAGYSATKEPAKSVLGKAYQTSQGVECKSNLSQIRQLIQIKVDEDSMDGERPIFTSFSEIGVPSSITKCPISHIEYTLKENNTVVCTFEGHENY